MKTCLKSIQTKNRKGKLKLNESPALIKEFKCHYEMDEENQQVVITGNAWFFAIYGSNLDVKEARFDMEEWHEDAFTVSWINKVSEDKPFFERFYLKKIE